jgi:hypothetical protein
MKNFCCCKELPETNKGQDIFNILSSYLESCGFHGAGVLEFALMVPPQ